MKKQASDTTISTDDKPKKQIGSEANTFRKAVDATSEEIIKTVQFGTETITQVITFFLLVFCLLVSILSFQKGWLIPLVLCGLSSIVIIALILRRLLKKNKPRRIKL